MRPFVKDRSRWLGQFRSERGTLVSLLLVCGFALALLIWRIELDRQVQIEFGVAEMADANSRSILNPIVSKLMHFENSVLAGWEHRAWLTAGATCVILVLLTLLGSRLSVQIRAMRRAEVESRESARRYMLLAQHSTDIIIQLTPGYRRTYVSPACLAMLGFTPDELLGQYAVDSVHAEDRKTAEASLAEISKQGHAPPFTIRVRHKDGSYVWVEGIGQKMDADEGLVIMMRNVTARRHAEDQLHKANNTLQKMIMQDGLTGIANRRCFDLVLDKEVRRSTRTGKPLALLLLDVDHFKSFNDTYGHPAGDDCLRGIASAVALHAKRGADLAARYGGEEFALLLPETDLSGAESLAMQLRDAVMALNITHAGAPRGFTTISVGVAVLNLCLGLETPPELVGRADQALYSAKKAGRNAVCCSTRTPDAGGDEFASSELEAAQT